MNSVQLQSKRPASPAPWRLPGAVLLVSCYELGHQPLNLAFPLAYLREQGFNPVAIDTAVDSLDSREIKQARLVAISVPMHTALRLGTRIAARVRAENRNARICFFGLYAWLNRDYLLRECGDFVIGGEYEQPLLQLALSLERGENDPTINGLSTREHDEPPVLERITFPMPVRDTLPNLRSYAHLMKDGLAIPAGYTEATRGCHHTCLHCPVVPIYRGRFFAVPRPVVLEDIRRQVQQGAGHITFGDPDFLNGPTHSLRIVRAMHDEFPHVTFDMTTRIEHIIQNRDLIPEFAASGCVFVVSAVEAVSELILQEIDKGHTKEDVVEALEILEAAGIAMRPSLLPFTPWTTIDDYLELLEFIETHDLIENVDPVHLSIRLLVPPGSALLDRPESAAWIGELDEEAYTYRWEHADPRIDQLQRQIAACVEVAEAEDRPAEETFRQIKQLAWSVKGADVPDVLRVASGERRRPPRLSESWFC